MGGGAATNLDHCTFRHSTADGARFFENSGGPITNTKFKNNAAYGLWLRGSSPEVSQSAFSDNGNACRLESGAGKGSFPGFTNTVFDGDDKVHIASHLDSSGTFTAAPYYLDEHRVAAADTTITIQGGATFTMEDYATWTIHGNVIADGSENAPILFTSVSGAAEGNRWRALRLTNNEGNGARLPSRLSYCTLEGGGYWYATLLEALGGAPLTLDHCNFQHSIGDGVRFWDNSGGTITNCTFQDVNEYGLRLQSSSPAIANSHFQRCGKQAVLLLSTEPNGASFPAFSNNHFAPDDYIEIRTGVREGWSGVREDRWCLGLTFI
jgi:parallel beta-helix repeat protein